ncbi:Undecaprenyl-phosphate 4-deoxy-4-formamido-L-arabinose transferase [Fundidesulfovibrio magnetotacticus]|uniref:Undecaprenyl-phosphate 4-deoxy-4-formamido-L-arabinose transferase n=1 Tax=Fundidesulfovibrio magnetotacticus TaxID=2730080 RepID=A0A6V8LYI9_9BACT|nr:glycosyltransferase family 2 protein [Fundidesulfovibrio magnetotacticus]GFK94866.1 Undecaprenyl-phosphate 4-deoxy-4-formamido-L-arabinose transferase [Fundidesulfovibrio magnetotacticus]
MRVSIIIPAYNEAENIGGVVSRILSLEALRGYEVVVVDDGSADDTARAAEAAGARVVRHPYNLGNGASVKSGAAAANGDVFVFMDADGQHLPEDIPKLLEHVGDYDMVVGARTSESDVSRFRAFGNRVLIATAQFLVGRKIDDLTSGFRAVKRAAFEDFAHLFPQGYSYPTTITMALFSAGRFVKYVPLPTIRRRQGGASNIQPVRDGLRFLFIMLRMIMLFNPFKVFLPLAGLFLTLGLLNGLHDAWALQKITASSMLSLILGFFLLFFGIMTDQIARTRRELHAILRKMR